MNGFVDEELRALLRVQVSAEQNGEKTPTAIPARVHPFVLWLAPR